MESVLKSMSENADEVLCIGYSYVDEDKVAPKRNPQEIGDSYFFNDRIVEFNSEFKDICNELDIDFISVIEKTNKEEWIKNSVYKDGLHPNDTGYTYIANLVWPYIESILQ